MVIGEGLILYSIGTLLLGVMIRVGLRYYRYSKRIVEESGPYEVD